MNTNITQTHRQLCVLECQNHCRKRGKNDCQTCVATYLIAV